MMKKVRYHNNKMETLKLWLNMILKKVKISRMKVHLKMMSLVYKMPKRRRKRRILLNL